MPRTLRSRMSASFPFLGLLLLVHSVSAQSEDDCRVLADPDILGLGVRLGLYFQIATTLLISVIRPEEGVDTILPTGLFVASFLTAVCYSTIRNDFPPGSIISCTWYPVLISVFMPFDLLKQHSKSYPKWWSRLSLGFALTCTSYGINIWFWFKGLDKKHPAQCMEPRVFFFANLSAYGNIRTFFKIVNVGILSIMISRYLWGFGNGLWEGFWEGFEESEKRRLEQLRTQAPAETVSDDSEVTENGSIPHVGTILTIAPSSTTAVIRKKPLWVAIFEVVHDWHYGSKDIITQPDPEMGKPESPLPTSSSDTSSLTRSESYSQSRGFWRRIWDGFTLFWECVFAFCIGFWNGFWGFKGESKDDTPDQTGEANVQEEVKSPNSSASKMPSAAAPAAATTATVSTSPSPVGTTEILTSEPSPTRSSSAPPPNKVLGSPPSDSQPANDLEAPELAEYHSWQRTKKVATSLLKATEIPVFVFYIVASELQFKWNHLDGIDSINTTGQLIPLALGSFSLVRALFIIRKG